MSIRYCEITIIHNQDNHDWLINLQKWFDYHIERPVTENSDIILLFDDETIYNIKNGCKDCNFKFFKSIYNFLPGYFSRKNTNDSIRNTTYFEKEPIVINNNKTLDYNKMFQFSEKYKKCKRIASSYNCIYYCYKNGCDKPEIFSILRIYSNEDKPRFLLAYDSEDFVKEEIIYLVYCFFYNKFTT